MLRHPACHTHGRTPVLFLTSAPEGRAAKPSFWWWDRGVGCNPRPVRGLTAHSSTMTRRRRGQAASNSSARRRRSTARRSPTSSSQSGQLTSRPPSRRPSEPAASQPTCCWSAPRRLAPQSDSTACRSTRQGPRGWGPVLSLYYGVGAAPCITRAGRGAPGPLQPLQDHGLGDPA